MYQPEKSAQPKQQVSNNSPTPLKIYHLSKKEGSNLFFSNEANPEDEVVLNEESFKVKREEHHNSTSDLFNLF